MSLQILSLRFDYSLFLVFGTFRPWKRASHSNISSDATISV